MEGLVKLLDNCKVEWINLLNGSGDRHQTRSAPLLFPIEFPATPRVNALLRWMSDKGRYSSSLLFLLTSLKLGELGQRLKLRTAATLPDKVPALLRYFDCRVFENLLRVLTREQTRDFLNPAECWWYVDRKGMLCKVRSHFQTDESPLVPLDLSVAQEAQLIDASEPDQVVEMLRSVIPAEFASLSDSRKFDFVTRHMTVARAIGIVATHELALYCSLALLYGNDFSTDRSWEDLLKTVAAGHQSLTFAVRAHEGIDGVDCDEVDLLTSPLRPSL